TVIVKPHLIHRWLLLGCNQVIAQRNVFHPEPVQSLEKISVIRPSRDHAICNTVALQHARKPERAYGGIARIVESRENNEIAGLRTIFLDTLEHTRVKRMQYATVAEDERDDRRSVAAEALCPRIGPEIHFANDALDLLPQLRIHIGTAVDHARNSTDRHARPPGHVLDSYGHIQSNRRYEAVHEAKSQVSILSQTDSRSKGNSMNVQFAYPTLQLTELARTVESIVF